MTLNKLVKKIRRELKDTDKIVDYNPVTNEELLMVSHKGKLYKKFQYISKEKGSYTGFERYFSELKLKHNWLKSCDNKLVLLKLIISSIVPWKYKFHS